MNDRPFEEQISILHGKIFFFSSRWCSVPRIFAILSRITPFYSRNFTFIIQEITNTLLKKFEGPYLHAIWHVLLLVYDVQYVTISMYRLDVRKTIKNVINTKSRPRWSSGYHTLLWIRGSLRSRPGSMDFFRA